MRVRVCDCVCSCLYILEMVGSGMVVRRALLLQVQPLLLQVQVRVGGQAPLLEAQIKPPGTARALSHPKQEKPVRVGRQDPFLSGIKSERAHMLRSAPPHPHTTCTRSTGRMYTQHHAARRWLGLGALLALPHVQYTQHRSLEPPHWNRVGSHTVLCGAIPSPTA